MKVSLGRFGAAASLGGVAAVFAVVGYLPLLMVAILYLSQTWFNGSYIMPLTIVAILHFAIAALFTFLAWNRWKITQRKVEKEAKAPPFEEHPS